MPRFLKSNGTNNSKAVSLPFYRLNYTLSECFANKINELMNSFLITCELNNQYGDYRPLVDKIVSFGGTWYRFTSNVWIIKSNLSPNDILTILKPHSYQNDKILVVQLVRRTSWMGLLVEEENWLDSNL